jgi:serine/threonine protein kinase
MADSEQNERIINRNWRVVRKIGQGGMGTVWEVRHKDIRRMRSAVKEIKADLASKQEVVRRFLREVRLMAELEGVDHIVRVTEFDRQEGFVFMTLVDGPSLAQMIKERGALPYEQVVRFGAQIASALHLVHERGIIHRDIKPDNVLIDEQHGKAYLTDFGIAKKLDLSEGDETIDGTMTIEGTLTVDVQYMGTPRYSSPEQLRVEYPPTPLWDIYAMGVLLYESYSGARYLSQLKKYHEFLQHVATAAAPIPAPYATPPPPGFAALIEACLQPDPARRMQSAGELTARLRECEEELQRVVITPGVRPRVAEPSADDQETVKETFGPPRRDLRHEIEQRFGALEEIEGTLVAAGLNLPAGPASETLGHALHDISVIEGEGQYQEALGRLETLREQAAAAYARAEQSAREGLARRVDELATERNALEERAGPWRDPAALDAADAALAAAARALAGAHWRTLGDELPRAAAAVAAVRTAHRARAVAAIDPALAALAEACEAARRLDAAAVPGELDLDRVRAALATHLAGDDLAAAAEALANAEHLAATALERARAAAAARLGRARDAVERLAAGLDAAAARRAAPALLDAVERHRSAAAAAESAGDVTAAIAAYEEARGALAAAGAAVESAQAAERRARAEALRALLAEIGDAPDAVVGDARAAAIAALEQPPAAHDAALDALAAAATAIEAARAALPAYFAAVDRRAAADAARAAAAEAALSAAEREQGEQAHSAAGAAFGRRAWNDAAARYDHARARWETLVTAARGRAERDQYAALEHALTGDLQSLAALDAAHAALERPAGALPAVAALRDAAAQWRDRAAAGELTVAIAGMRALRAQVADARAAFDAALRDAVEAARAALAGRADALAVRAGALLDEATRSAVAAAIADVEAAARAGTWADAPTVLTATSRLLDDTERAVRAEAERAVRERSAALAADLEQLAALETTPPEGIVVATIAARAAAAVETGEYAAALREIAAAADTTAAAKTARERELREQVRAARAAVDTARSGLDVVRLRALASPEVERIDRGYDAATQAADAGRYLDALRAYDAARGAIDAAARLLDERRRAERAALEAERSAARAMVDPLVARAAAAPAVVVGEALGAARALREDSDADPQALRDAAVALERALDLVPVHATAVERREAAGAAEAQLAQRRLPRKELKAVRTALGTAARAFERHEWSIAAEQYAEAGRLAVALAAEPPRQAARWPYVAAAAVVVLAAAAALVAYRQTLTPAAAPVVASKPIAPPAAPVPPHVEQPPAAAPAIPYIASAEPSGSDVHLQEGGAQKFSLQLADATDATNIEWLVAGQPVADARGATAWTYRPDASAPAGKSYAVTARVGDGSAERQVRSWQVTVNHPPRVTHAQPPPGQELKKDVGQTASFSVDAADPDGDALTYRWTVDGKAVGGNSASLDVPVEREHAVVALAISDAAGSNPLHLEWQLTGKAIATAWAAQPPALKELAFGSAQSFKLAAAGGKVPSGAQIAWAVNGQKVADGPSFAYQATDAGMVGAPVQIRVTANDPNGAPFSKEWSVVIKPPAAPKITGATPAAGIVQGPAGQAQTLSLTSAAPVNGQRFTYVFDVDGKETTSAVPSITVTPAESGDTTVVAAIEDNFKQRSKDTRWVIRPAAKPPAAAAPAPDASALVRGWLDQYRSALNGKDVPTQCALLALDAGRCTQLANAVELQNKLQVAFDGVALEPLPDGRVRARYTRVDNFLDPTGKAQSRSAAVTQTFRVVNGKAQLDKTGQ